MAIENKCPLCGKVNPNTEWYCEACGAKLPLQGNRSQTQKEAGTPSPIRIAAESQAKANNAAVWILLGIIGLATFALSMFFWPHSPNNPTPEQVAIAQPAPTSALAVTFPTRAPSMDASGSAPAHTFGSGGATCMDGTHSASSGRGACSHHGGVAHWN